MKKSTKKTPQHTIYNISAIGIEAAVIVFLGVWAGVKLDEICGLSLPLFKVFLPLLSIFAALYTIIKTLKNK